MGIVDAVLGPFDEWFTSRLIAHWRDEVWEQALHVLGTQAPDERERIRQRVECSTLKRADAILLGDVSAVVSALI